MWIFSVSVWVVAYKIKITLFTFRVINYNYMPHEKIHQHSLVVISVWCFEAKLMLQTIGELFLSKVLFVFKTLTEMFIFLEENA